MLTGLRRIALGRKYSVRRRRLVVYAVHAAGWWATLLAPRRYRRRSPGRLPPAARILLVRVDGIGDLIMTSPVFPALRRAYPAARIDLLCSDAAKPVAEMMREAGWFDELIVMRLGARDRAEFAAAAQAVRAGRYDAAIDLRGDFRNVLILWEARVPLTVGQATSGADYLLDLAVHPPRNTHQARVAAEQVKLIGVDVDRFEPLLPVPESDAAAARAWMAGRGLTPDRPIVAIHLTAWLEVKVWPVERFAEVARRLIDQHGAQVVAIGGKNDREVGERFAELVGRPVVLAAGELNLRHTAALLAACAAMIGNDSGPAHVASAVGTPVVDLFGPAPVDVYRPLSPTTTVLKSPRACEPGCGGTCARPRERCLLDITADQVYAAADAHLARGRGRPAAEQHREAP